VHERGPPLERAHTPIAMHHGTPFDWLVRIAVHGCLKPFWQRLSLEG